MKDEQLKKSGELMGLSTFVSRNISKAISSYQQWDGPRQLHPNYAEDRPFIRPADDPTLSDVFSILPTFHGSSIVDAIESRLREDYTRQHPLKVLDICCGTGRAGFDIEKLYPGRVEVYGYTAGERIDTNGASLMKLPQERIKYGNVALLHDLWQGSCFGEFDIVYSCRGLEYIPLPAPYFMEEIYRILKPGGIAFVDIQRESYITDPLNRIYKYQLFLKSLAEKGFRFDIHGGRMLLTSQGGKIDLSTLSVDSFSMEKTLPLLKLDLAFDEKGGAHFVE